MKWVWGTVRGTVQGNYGLILANTAKFGSKLRNSDSLRLLLYPSSPCHKVMPLTFFQCSLSVTSLCSFYSSSVMYQKYQTFPASSRHKHIFQLKNSKHRKKIFPYYRWIDLMFYLHLNKKCEYPKNHHTLSSIFIPPPAPVSLRAAVSQFTD